MRESRAVRHHGAAVTGLPVPDRGSWFHPRRAPYTAYSGMLLSGGKPSLQTQMAARGLRP